MRGLTTPQRFARALVAGFFAVSATAKAFDAADFSRVLQRYGVGGDLSPWLAGGLIVGEALLAGALLLPFAQRALTGLAAGVLVIFSASFAYGHFTLGLQDCGCFGNVTALQTSPVVSMVRNAVLLLLTLYAWPRRSAFSVPVDARPPTAFWSTWASLVFVVAVASAYTLGRGGAPVPVVPALATIPDSPGPANPRSATAGLTISTDPLPLSESPLGAVVVPAPQQIRLVVGFGLRCGHCWDAMENIKAWLNSGLVDVIEGYSSGTDDESAEFYRRFQPTFNIELLADEDRERIFPVIPTAYLIRNDIIVATFTGGVPSPQRWAREQPAWARRLRLPSP